MFNAAIESKDYGRATGYLNKYVEKVPFGLSQIHYNIGFKDGRIEYLSDMLQIVEDLLNEGKVQEAKNVLASRRK